MPTLLGNETVEGLHLFHREIVQDHETLYDRLHFPIEKLVKRYLRQNLSMALKFRCEHDLTAYWIYARIVYIPLHDIEGNVESTHIEHEDKFFMFIRNVEFVNDIEKRIVGIGGVIGLKVFNQPPEVNIGDSLYLSFVTGKQVLLRGPLFKDRELDIARFFTCAMANRREQPCDVIEAGSVMVNNLSCQNCEAQRDGAIPVILNLLKEKLFIVLAENGVVAFFKEPLNLRLQIEDVMLGPL